MAGISPYELALSRLPVFDAAVRKLFASLAECTPEERMAPTVFGIAC